MTTIVRYYIGGTTRVGVLEEQRIRPLAVESVASLLSVPLAEARAVVQDPTDDVVDPSTVCLLAPVDQLTEVWASGVTYERSRDARVEESSTHDIYQRVYEAERPELFFKAAAWRVVPDGHPIAVRVDSAQNVPEPELILAVNRYAEIVGYSVGNDMSSRQIEGANPLYLPQAKVYDASFSMASGIRPAWELPNVSALAIEMEIARDGGVVWYGSTSTDRLARTFEDLVEHLFRCYSLPHGVLLSTGTGSVPELDFSTLPGDQVRRRVDGGGTLCNPVVETGTLPARTTTSTTERTR
jgi:2-dehydro-3-deoxy-D-arabinonate dehydratase